MTDIALCFGKIKNDLIANKTTTTTIGPQVLTRSSIGPQKICNWSSIVPQRSSKNSSAHQKVEGKRRTSMNLMILLKNHQ